MLRGKRGVQVVHALREHGPLNIKTIQRVLYPPIELRRCQEVVQNLYRKKYIDIHRAILGSVAHGHYYISENKLIRKKVAAFLGIDAADFRVCSVQDAELPHAEECALWAAELRRMFPDGRVVRDWELQRDADLSQHILPDWGNRDCMPDLVLSIDREGDAQPILLAVEIERSRKAFPRLRKKLHSLAWGATYDGVLYVCENQSIRNAVFKSIDEKDLLKSRRIGTYVDHYFQFCFFGDWQHGLELPMCNSKLGNTTLTSWISTLKAHPVRQRRNFHFTSSSVTPLVN